MAVIQLFLLLIFFIGGVASEATSGKDIYFSVSLLTVAYGSSLLTGAFTGATSVLPAPCIISHLDQESLSSEFFDVSLLAVPAATYPSPQPPSSRCHSPPHV